MFKKLFIGIVIALLALGIIYLYFLYAGNPAAVRSRIGTYKLYTAIFFVSIVAIFMLQGRNKVFNFLIFVIVVINLFILGDTFFRNNVGLSSIQFLTLFALILLALAITYITHWVRYILMIAVCLGIGFVVLSGSIPLYKDIPSLSDFIQSQKAKIVNQGGNTEGVLVIKNALGTKQIPLDTLTQTDIDLSQKTQISFLSKTQSGLEKLFIDLGNGSFININPQSAVTLEQSGGNTTMQILQGNVQYYLPAGLSGALNLIGKYKGKSIKDIQNNVRSGLVSQFEQKKQDFFVNQLGGSLIFNPTVDKTISFFINMLYKISPKTYEQNLNNYNNVQQYLGKITTGAIAEKFTGENIKSMISDIVSQVKKGASETQINGRLK